MVFLRSIAVIRGFIHSFIPEVFIELDNTQLGKLSLLSLDQKPSDVWLPSQGLEELRAHRRILIHVSMNEWLTKTNYIFILLSPGVHIVMKISIKTFPFDNLYLPNNSFLELYSNKPTGLKQIHSRSVN